MEIRTRVREVHGDQALLGCEQARQCTLCGSGGGCGLRLLGASRARHLTVPRCPGWTRPLVTGDAVLVSVADGAIVRAAAQIYLLPLAGLLAGAGLAQLAGLGDGVAFMAAVGGALAGVVCGRRAEVQFQVIPGPRGPGNADA